ncbi:MAG TPA: hypothetical protein VK149_04110 [Sideroxyarcus sp.]|nr:hypothetical protein [Sideroxyarcus sp.]
MFSLDETKTSKLIEALRSGVDLTTAAHFAGVNYATVYRLMESGQRNAERAEAGQELDDGEQATVDFWETLRKARADAVVRNVAQIQKAAAQGEWKAAAWWLERSTDSFKLEK